MKSTTIRVLAILLTAAVMLGVTSCSLNGNDAEETTETTVASATVLPTDKGEILNYFNQLMVSVKNGKAKLNYSTSYDPKDFSLEDKSFSSLLKIVSKLMNFETEDKPLGGEVEYGQSLATYIPIKNSAEPLQLTAADIKEIFINPDEFNKLAEESQKSAEDKDYTSEAVNLDPDTRKITITLIDEVDPSANGSLFGKIYALPDRELIANEFKKAADYLTYDGTYTAKYTGCTIYMEIDRVTDSVKVVEFSRNIEVAASVTGVGTLSQLGTQELTFVVNGRDRYEFDWTDPATVQENK